MQGQAIENVIRYFDGSASVWRKVATDTLHFGHKAELLADSGNKRIDPWLDGVGWFGRRLAICRASCHIDETESYCGNN